MKLKLAIFWGLLFLTSSSISHSCNTLQLFFLRQNSLCGLRHLKNLKPNAKKKNTLAIRVGFKVRNPTPLAKFSFRAAMSRGMKFFRRTLKIFILKTPLTLSKIQSKKTKTIVNL